MEFLKCAGVKGGRGRKGGQHFSLFLGGERKSGEKLINVRTICRQRRGLHRQELHFISSVQRRKEALQLHSGVDRFVLHAVGERRNFLSSFSPTHTERIFQKEPCHVSKTSLCHLLKVMACLRARFFAGYSEKKVRGGLSDGTGNCAVEQLILRSSLCEIDASLALAEEEEEDSALPEEIRLLTLAQH